MDNEIAVSVVVVEMEDGTFWSECPDLGLESKGATYDEAFKSLGDEIVRHIKDVGAGNVKLRPVKCKKLRIPV